MRVLWRLYVVLGKPTPMNYGWMMSFGVVIYVESDFADSGHVAKIDIWIILCL